MSKDTLLDVIEKIYQAATEPDEWIKVCDHLGEIIGSDSALLMSHDPQNKSTQFLYDSWTFTEDWTKEAVLDFVVNFAKKSPLFSPMLRTKSGEILTDHGHRYSEDYLNSEAYNDFFMRYESERSMVMPIDMKNGDMRYISMRRSAKAGFFDDEQGLFLQRTHPHLERAFQISDELFQAKILKGAFELSLNNIPTGIVLLDQSGQMQFMNSIAEHILKKEDGVFLHRDGRLGLNTAAENIRYQELLASVLKPDDSLVEGIGGSMAVSRPSFERSYGLLVAPMPNKSGERNFTKGVSRPVAMVFLKDPKYNQFIRATDISAIMGLTPREAELVAELIEGRSAKEIASKLGITVGTTRYYIKEILQKTETNRQSELVATVLCNVPLSFAHIT